MEDEGFKIQPSGKIFNGEIFKPTTTIPIFIKMNKISGEIRTPNIIQRNNIEFLVQVSMGAPWGLVLSKDLWTDPSD